MHSDLDSTSAAKRCNSRAVRAAVAVGLALSLLAAACGDDEDTASVGTPGTAAEPAVPEPPESPPDDTQGDEADDGTATGSDTDDGTSGETPAPDEQDEPAATNGDEQEPPVAEGDGMDASGVDEGDLPDMDDDAAVMACLLEGLTADEAAGLLVGEEPGPDAMATMFACAPDMLIDTALTDMGIEPGTVTDQQRSCLIGVFSAVDWDAIESADSAMRLLGGLFDCLPESMDLVESLGAGPAIDVTALDGVDLIRPGESVEGYLADEGGVVVYSFTADGTGYRVDVEPITLDDPAVTVYDSSGRSLAHNDDAHDGTYAASVEFTGDDPVAYIGVSGWLDETGSFTVTVTERDATS